MYYCTIEIDYMYFGADLAIYLNATGDIFYCIILNADIFYTSEITIEMKMIFASENIIVIYGYQMILCITFTGNSLN